MSVPVCPRDVVCLVPQSLAPRLQQQLLRQLRLQLQRTSWRSLPLRQWVDQRSWMILDGLFSIFSILFGQNKLSWQCNVLFASRRWLRFRKAAHLSQFQSELLWLLSPLWLVTTERVMYLIHYDLGVHVNYIRFRACWHRFRLWLERMQRPSMPSRPTRSLALGVMRVHVSMSDVWLSEHMRV